MGRCAQRLRKLPLDTADLGCIVNERIIAEFDDKFFAGSNDKIKVIS
ncbi:hypothetical protein B4067_2016 [Bacillus subtilis subsp. subtilis]|uniref:Uncharacterized protein n=1 Tax=Bacillus subtilis subsp. subtilis TaxID=135461 RepID=A0ABD3ZSB6_BACIU|nr:hypothetical protein B4067_2016 [Bacillus subtilis subsp. subtilis]